MKNQQATRHIALFALGAAALLLGMLLAGDQRAARAAAYGGPVGCERTVVKDYLKSLARGRPIREIPESGVLPFGPRGLRLNRIGSGPTVGGEAVGFFIGDTATDQRRRLNWVIRTTLVRVAANGRPLGVSAEKVDRVLTRNFEEDTGSRQKFSVSAKPANYRVDIRFETVSERALGSYSEYFRVMESRYHPELVASDRVVEPGQKLKAALENRGTEPIRADLRVGIQLLKEGKWLDVGAVYPGGKRMDGRAYVYGGEAGRCVVFKVPGDLDSGEYRLTQDVRRYLRDGQERRVVAPFQVGLPE